MVGHAGGVGQSSVGQTTKREVCEQRERWLPLAENAESAPFAAGTSPCR